MAAKKRSVENSVCLNHPDRPAVTRCDVCFKPICDACAISTGEGTYCSRECAEKYEDTKESIGAWQAQRDREKSRRRRRRLVMLVILIGFLGTAYWYFTGHPGKLDELKDKAGSIVQEVRGLIGL